jgi:cytochrome c-type biogenesis protein CcmF
MRTLGEACLLAAFVSSGFAAFACLAGAARPDRRVRLAGLWAAGASVLGLTVVAAVLAWALYQKDFSFAYVAQYSSNQLPWHYSLSALWVGQAGSLLLWAWFVGVLALLFRWWPPRHSRSPVSPGLDSEIASWKDATTWAAFGVLMAYLCFLTAVMVFAADPMEASLSAVREGGGLSPLLQHPAMLIHPPVVFLGYALWTVPFALAIVALVSGRLEGDWIRQARPWALSAWTVLGVGILLGADWAYEELGWGGYWGWDPVENGSLIPWLTGTALIHGLMAWQHGQALKKTTIGLAIATFALCNFATFLTRSGVFSSLHAFSASPIGWLFLVLMIGLAGLGVAGLIRRRALLAPDRPIRSVLCREAMVLLAALALLLLAATAVAGTVSTALSAVIYGQAVMVGPAFYNAVLIPAGLTLLLTAALAPLLRWGQGPSRVQKKWLIGSSCAGGAALAATALMGVRHPVGLAVAGLTGLAVVAFAGAVLADGTRRDPVRTARGLLAALRRGRRQYAGFVIHMGLMCLALGVAGSSLGKREQGFLMREGQTVEWAGRSIRLARVTQRELPDKLAAEAVLEISRGGRLQTTLVPAQHYHKLQRVWTTEVAIQSTWGGDFFTILHSGTPDGPLSLTFVENPLMRWLWMGGAIMVVGTGLRLWPGGQKSARPAGAQPAEEQREAEPAAPRRVVVPPPLSRQRERRLRASDDTVRVPVGGRRPRVKLVDEENSTNRGEP